MKKLKFFILSFIAFTMFSCSEENNLKNDKTAITKISITGNTGTGSTRKLAVDDCGIAKQTAGPADTGYNCFGLAFYFSETGNKAFINDQNDIKRDFIDTGIFIEDSTSNATKVIYWNNETDFNARNFTAVDHAAIIVEGGNVVYSKEGSNELKKNCIGHVYLDRQHYYQTYSLNLELNPYETNPVRKVPFAVSLAHDASTLLNAQYDWVSEVSDYSYVQITRNGASCSIKFNGNAPKKMYTFTLKAKHQRGNINGVSFAKDLTKTFTIDLKGNPDPVPTASFTGSSYVTKTNMGSWSATVSGGTPPYTYSWWLKRHEDPISFYLQMGTGTELYLLTKTSVKSTYYDLYFRVIDSNNQIFSTAPQIIQSTGVLEEAF